MNDSEIDSPEAMKTFLAGTDNLEFQVPKKERYTWIALTLKRIGYERLRKRDKSIACEYIQVMTGYSGVQLKRLIAQYRKTGKIKPTVRARHSFASRYTHDDKLLLAKTDEMHQTLSGAITKKLLERAYTIYHDPDYERLAFISVSHLYNLRKTKTYQCQRRHFRKTNKTAVQIGERRKPTPEDKPGYIRIDTVHQGDKDRKKGVYHINAVDEVTQFEVICSVEKISENYLIPILEELLDTFPFVVINFHSDNGKEFINKTVARLLNKLHVEMTKSRARHSNDNALVECKNGAIVRKYLGYVHITQNWAPLINTFYRDYLNPYLNYHRPCYFAKTIIDKKGKEKKTYPYHCMMTPYEKLKSLPNATAYLKPGITFNRLDEVMIAKSDLQAAEELKKAQSELFREVFSNPS